MKLIHFNIGLKPEDFLVVTNPGSENPMGMSLMVSDFSFQADFFSDYMIKKLKLLKFKTDGFNQILINGRKNRENLGVELMREFKTLELSTEFDEKIYKSMSPIVNEYPVGVDGKLLLPIENEIGFSELLYEMTIKAVENAKEKKADIPIDSILETLEIFKEKGFRHEGVFKRRVFGKESIVGILYYRYTCNYFSLELRLESKDGSLLFTKEILKTIPHPVFYGQEFKDIALRDNSIVVTQSANIDGPELYRIPLDQALNT